ncbi:unnamed protein product [Prorocentrum cordatum]|uniref:Uncharacterized protein n=1 Tax=Prorocentrum cordatum TaxID=2364126 RepID=A0ABN9U1F3_9DINO|nr:unnamed protein product [Polarella glacialis]
MRSTGATWHRSVRAGRGRGAEAPETRRRDAAETSQNLAAGPPDPLAASSCEGRPGPQLGGPLAAAAVVSAGAGPRQRTRRAGGGREARRAPSRRRRRARLPGADAGGAQRPGRPESSAHRGPTLLQKLDWSGRLSAEQIWSGWMSVSWRFHLRFSSVAPLDLRAGPGSAQTPCASGSVQHHG